MTYTERLIDNIIHSEKESIPAEVIEHTKIFILDTLGCAIGGYCTKIGKQIVAQAEEFRGGGEASLIGTEGTVSLPLACWANSTLANLLDMDDVYAGAAHQANCLVPTAIGVGEAQNASGLEVIHAIVVGFEVGSRIMMYSMPSLSKARTYFPSTWQIFDAVTVAGKLLGLGEKQLYDAFGLAGKIAPLPIDLQKSAEHHTGFPKGPFGWSTFSGVFWTLLAQKGVSSGTAHVFDGDAGFWAAMGSDNHDCGELVRDIGDPFTILDTKYKPYPLCTWGHSSADAVKKIFEQNSISAQDIESIKVKTIQRAIDLLSRDTIESIFNAQFCLPYAISMLALRKMPHEWMSEENIFYNQEAKTVAKKVTMEVDPAAERTFSEEKGLAIPSVVEVKLNDGSLFQETVKYSKGTPKNPFTTQELKDKFRVLASALFSARRIDTIMETVESLEMINDISDLTELLRAE
ncbi:MAG: MmgE/PrpD family protein [Deltaproteobacteria bacterium]|nr:MmgE/PrpD family protein [Deltaproteobacteria bacterium]